MLKWRNQEKLIIIILHISKNSLYYFCLYAKVIDFSSINIEQVRDIINMQLLGDLLPERAGSLLSLNSLREDLEVSHRAVSNWMNILESFYYCFRIYPYAAKNFRSLKKEAKLYLWDWSEIDREPARFENCIASHLLKLVHFLHKREGIKLIIKVNPRLDNRPQAQL